MMLFVIFFIPQNVYPCYLLKMSSDKTTMSYKVSQIEERYLYEIDFGLWSQYLPLENSNFWQVPPIQDKVCYINIQVINQNTNKVDFLYYDCLDYQKMKITKNLELYDQTGEIQQYQITIDNFKYESIWYYFSFQFYPSSQQFSFSIFNVDEVLSQKFGNYVFPFEINLRIIVGGQQVIESNPQYDKFNINLQTLYYFPGSKYECFVSNVILNSTTFLNFQCDLNYNEKNIKSIDLTGQNTLKLGLDQKNCDSFFFSIWIKIQKIQSSLEKYIYKLIQISSWNENKQLQNSNLSPFQLIYKIQNEKLYVQFTTYSYTLPITVINFENDPFLLSKEFEIINDYNQWSLLNVAFEYEVLNCSLLFIDQYNYEYKYQAQFKNVKHFKNVQFQVQLGNINKDIQNFLSVSFYELTFYNSNYLNKYWACHRSCQTCDGPTQFNCLSCDQNKNRQFLQSQKACICTLENLDDGSGLCQSFQDFQFSVKNMLQAQQSSCPFGYFSTSNDECKLCPTSTIKSYFYCLECIQNPTNWLQNSICETTVFFDSQSSRVASQIKIQLETLIFDSEELQTCRNCLNEDPIEDRYQNFQETQLNQIHNQYQDKYICDENCDECILKIDGVECVLCEDEIINGICVLTYGGELFYCKTPYYYNSQDICTLCKIQNCQYCFEYLSNDLTQCTLYYSYAFEINEFHKVGCALCYDGFIFDFTLGECIFQQSKISNCLRSFINLDGIEVCTLSSIHDFTVAPQIINCQQFIENCQECIQTPFQTIKCIVCEPGYGASTFSGKCEECIYEEFSTLCLEGGYLNGDGWVQLIQSFLMQFLPEQYFYPPPGFEPSFFSIFCEDGYRSNSKYQCEKYCSNDCLNCQEIDHQFVCIECPFNQNFQIMRSQVNGRCLECPSICVVCSPRESSEISKLNSQFILTDQNEIYTQKCLMAVSNPKIILDSNLQIARYLISSQEDEILVYEVVINSNNYIWIQNAFENNINHFYLNQIGAKKFQIDFKLDFSAQFFQWRKFIFNFESALSQKIFSLQQIISNITGIQSRNYLCTNLTMNGFDLIYMSQVYFEVEKRIFFKFLNSYNNIEVYLQHLTFHSSQNTLPDQQIQINTTPLKNFIMQNITFKNLNFSDSYILNLSLEHIQRSIIFDSLIFINCRFQSMNVLNFQNSNYPVIFKQIEFQKCNFVDTKLFNIISIQKISFQYLLISNSYFNSSTIIEGDIKTITFVYVTFIENQIVDSTLIIISGDILTDKGEFLKNEFCNSLLFYLKGTNDMVRFQKFQNISFSLGVFQNSSLFDIQSSQNQKHSVVLDFLKFQFFLFNNKEIFNFIFTIQCQSIFISNFEIRNSQNYNLFQMKNVSQISIKNISIQADEQLKIYPFQSLCVTTDKNNFLGLFQIIEFNTILFQNITIKNFYIADSIIIEIISNQMVSVLKGYIIFERINFEGNILRKIQTNMIASLIYIYSNTEYLVSLNQINFKDNFYFAQSQDLILGSSSFLLLINCYACNIQIKDINCEKNMLFNSTNSFMKITANNLKIENYNVKQHNLIKWNDLRSYFIIEQPELSQDQINSFVNNILGIKNKACAGSFQINSIQIKNGEFYDLIAQNVPVFDITTISDGIVSLYNLSISFVTLLYSTAQEYRGTIHINSIDSRLSLEIKNSIFSEVNHFTNSPIISISPSNYRNQIVLVNVDFINCFSIQSLILSLNLNNLQDQSYLEIMNTTFYSDLISFKQYTNNIGKQRVFETAIFESNILLQVSGCLLIIKNISVSGLVLSRILSITDLPKFSMINSNFQNIQQLVPSNLLYFSQLIFSNSILRIENCIFQNISTLNQLPSKQKEYNINLKIKYSDKCYLEYLTLEYVEEFYFNSILSQTSFTRNGAIIFISNVHSKMKIIIQNNQIIYNQCTFCIDGGIYISFVQKSKLIISDLVCYKNSFNQNGCLNLISTLQNGELVKIDHSIFFNNQGTKGTAVSTVQLKLQIKNSYLINNNATDKGGAIYIENFVQNSKIQNSLIQNNKANFGGGIYIDSQEVEINEQSLQNSWLNFNEAAAIGNNLVDQPTHLQISINNIEFKSIKTDDFNRQIELQPFKILEQGQLKFSDVLMLPSGQQIKMFKLFNPKSKTFYNYIISVILTVHNSLNEKQNNLTNTQCFLFETLFDQNFLNISDQQLIKQIQFDQEKQGFDFSDYSFDLDPYINHYLMVNIKCQNNQGLENENSATQIELQKFGFQFLIRTLKCQLGEFFVGENCQVCDSQQGYYSVKYNVTKCSLFDTEKFEAITSNQIKLKAGYWRPNVYSDLTEYCLKNPDYCIGGWKGGNHLCSEGHVGALCEECDIYNLIGNGNFQKVQKVRCANCNTQNQNIFNYFLTILWSILSLFISLRSVNKSKQLFRILILNNRYGKIIFKFDQDYQGFILKMLLNYIWIFSIIFGLNLNYQFNFTIFDQASNSSYYLASNLDCFLSENFDMELIYLRILVTYFYIISLFLSMNFILLISSKISNNQFDKSAITNCLLYLYVQNNSSLIQNFASLISQRIVSDLSFIQGDVTLRFDTETHSAWIKYFIIPNLVFIGMLIPGFLISFLATKKNDLDKISLRNHFCYLYNEYSNSCFFWEQVKIWKKVLIIIIISYYENSLIHKICLIGVCLILYHHNLATTQPFITKNLNKLDLQSVQYCSICVFIAGLLYASDQIGNLQLALILYIIQIFLIVRTIFPFIIWIFRIFKKRQILLYILFIKVCKFLKLKKFQRIFIQYISKLTLREKKLKQNIQNLQRYLRDTHHKTIQLQKFK